MLLGAILEGVGGSLQDIAANVLSASLRLRSCRVGVRGIVRLTRKPAQASGGVVASAHEYTTSPSYQRHRFPVEIISHAVWLSFRFSLRYRDVAALMAARGIVLSYETIRQWCQKFGQQYANQLRRRRAQTSDKWHLDAVFLNINGKLHSLW